MNVLLEVPTFEVCLEFGDDFKFNHKETNLCSGSWCKWLVKGFSDASIKLGKRRKSARPGEKILGKGEQ